jgi:hypothetical protein
MLGDLPGFVMWNEPLVGKLFGRFYRQERAESRGRAFIFSKEHRAAWLQSISEVVIDGARARFPQLGGQDHLVIKEPHGNEGAPLLSEAFPQSRMILLIRDPRDTIASDLDAQRQDSWATKVGRRRGLSTGPTRAEEHPEDWVGTRAQTYMRDLTAARQAYDSHPGPKALILYERLRYAPLDTLRDLCRRLELPVTDLDLAHVVAAHDWERIPAEEKGSGKFHRKAVPGGWREDLSPEQVRRIDEVVAPIVEEHYASRA